MLIAYSGLMESAKVMMRFVQMDLFPNVTPKVVTFGLSDAQARLLLDEATEYCSANIESFVLAKRFWSDVARSVSEGGRCIDIS